jgi:hypothetical protein
MSWWHAFWSFEGNTDPLNVVLVSWCTLLGFIAGWAIGLWRNQPGDKPPPPPPPPDIPDHVPDDWMSDDVSR